MKILGISAGRRNGNCELLTKQALKGAEAAGCEVQFLRLQDFKILPCTGCTACIMRKYSGLQSACTIPDEADDYAKYVDLVLEADGFIIGAPCYNLTVAGRMLDANNRKHCFLSQLKERCAAQPKFAATIGVGGSDWTNFLMPVLNFVANEHCGSKLNLVDQMLVENNSEPGLVILEDELLARAYKLGENVASVVLAQDVEHTYRGDCEEVCPLCHGSHLQLYHGKLICPTCNTVAHVTEEDGKPVIRWETPAELSRWSEYGDQKHMGAIRSGAQRFHQNKDLIQEKAAQLRSYLEPVKP